jgi:phasin
MGSGSGGITLLSRNSWISLASPTHTLLVEEFVMDTNPKMKSKTDAPEQFRDIGEKSAKQSKEVFEKMSAASGQAADVMKNCCSTAVKGAQDYNNRLFEFTHANSNAAFDFAKRMSGVKSPSEFVELSTELAQQQLATLTEQTRQLAALAQQVTLSTTEPFKAGFTKESAWS